MELYRRLYRRIRIISYYVFSKFSKSKAYSPSNTPIDVAIMVLEKDLSILPLCIEGVRRCVKQNIKSIYIISPKSTKIIDFCNSNNLKWHNELSILNYGPKDMGIIVNKEFRSGWLFQQLIKLSGAVGNCRYTLFIDADHILLKPHVFLDKSDTPIYYMSSEFHLPYYTNICKILKKIFIFPPYLSFVAHKMCFDKRNLENIHRLLENNYPGKSWDQIIIEQYDKHEQSGFSEFELYGFLFGKKGHWLPWNEHRLDYSQKCSYDELVQQYPTYRSITFPSFLNNHISK